MSKTPVICKVMICWRMSSQNRDSPTFAREAFRNLEDFLQKVLFLFLSAFDL